MATPIQETKIFTGIGLDFETGGLDCSKSACTQLALQSVRFDTWEVIDRFSHYILPYHKQEIGKSTKRKVLRGKHELQQEAVEEMEYGSAALSYSGITMETLIKNGVAIKEVATKTIELAKRSTLSKGHQYKPIIIGQNITFDIGFLQQMMSYAGLMKEFEKTFMGSKDFYGNFQPRYVDTIDLARLALANDPSMTSYKLELIAERLGIELDDAHDADADVTATLNIVRVCSGRMRAYSGDGNEGVVIHKNKKSRAHFRI